MIQNIGQYLSSYAERALRMILTTRPRCCDIPAVPSNAAHHLHRHLQYRHRTHGRQYRLQHAKRRARSQDGTESLDYPERVGVICLASPWRKLPDQ